MARDLIAPPEGDELLVVVGPTASGKTALAIDLAERFGAEIVSADSIQIYRRFDLGTGKPTAEERARVPHHLVDHLDPLAPMDASRFVELADAAIASVRDRGRPVIVCGGTFLWVKALLHGLAPMPPADPALRDEHTRIAARDGRAALHQQLEQVDPEAAARLAPNDLVRVSRALEVHALTGVTQTAWHAQHQFAEARHSARLYGIDRDREALDARIRARIQQWLAAGWIDQVRTCQAEGLSEARPMGAVGFRQIATHLAGDLPLDELEDAIVRATRKLVRRQRTWLRDEPVTWLAPDGEAPPAEVSDLHDAPPR